MELLLILAVPLAGAVLVAVLIVRRDRRRWDPGAHSAGDGGRAYRAGQAAAGHVRDNWTSEGGGV